MKLLYAGKTKNVYRRQDGDFLMRFKDDVTGTDGVFDPGANTVGLSLPGAGQAGLRLSTFFFQALEADGIPTHYIRTNLADNSMVVRAAAVFGRGLEVICRFRAVGSFLRRYSLYVAEEQELDAFVEVTIKDDDNDDPPITKDALVMLGILSADEYETLKTRTQKISRRIKAILATKGLELYDIKLEFGRDRKTKEILLIDEISGGNMRAYKDGVCVPPLELEQILLGEDCGGIQE